MLPTPKTTIISQGNNSVNSNIIFTNNVNSQLEKNIIGNIPLSSTAAVEPNYGKYIRGEVVFNATPIIGGYIGWVCISPGTANGNKWTAVKSIQ